VRMVWMRRTHDYFFNLFGCEDGLDEEDPWLISSTYLDVRTVWMRTHDCFNIFGMWGWSACPWLGSKVLWTRKRIL
jgi:hypothetical protein